MKALQKISTQALFLMLLAVGIFVCTKETKAEIFINNYGYDHDSDIANNGTQSIVQKLGTSLTGTVIGFTMTLNASTTSSQLRGKLWECDNDGNPYLSTCTNGNSYQSNQQNLNSGRNDYYFELTTSHDFNPNKYYLLYAATDDNIPVRYSGFKLETYTPKNTECLDSFIVSCGIIDASFTIDGINITTQTTRIIQINTPSNYSTTTQTQITFNYDYYFANQTGTLKAGFVLQDQNSGQSATQEKTASTGTGNLTKTITLTFGHNYQWTPYLLNTTSNNQWQGGTYYFSIGQTTSTTTSQQTATTTPFTTDTGNLPSIVGYIQQDPFIREISTKFPFSYAFDIVNVIKEFYQSTSTNSLTIGIPDFQGKTATTSFTVFSETNDTVNTYTRLFRTPVRYAIWTFFGMMLPKIIISAI